MQRAERIRNDMNYCTMQFGERDFGGFLCSGGRLPAAGTARDALLLKSTVPSDTTDVVVLVVVPVLSRD